MKRQSTNEFDKAFERMYAAMKVKKSVQIKLRRGCADRQRKDLEIVMEQCKKVIAAESCEEIMTHTGIAVGYANAMQQHGLISSEELQELIDMLDEIGTDRMEVIDEMNRNIISRLFRKKVAS